MTAGDVLGEIVTRPEEWTSRFMGIATLISTWSKDPRAGVGALLVTPDRRQMSPGYNGFPRRMIDSRQRLLGPEKNRLTVHAEVNAMDNAGFRPEGCTLYVTRFPCLPCALSLVNRGVVAVVTAPPRPGSSWYGSMTEALEAMQEAGVHVTMLEKAPMAGAPPDARCPLHRAPLPCLECTGILHNHIYTGHP